MAENGNAQPMQASGPDPALNWLERLVGTWRLSGRTLDVDEDNIHGWTTIEWLPGGFFLQLRGEIEFKGFKAQSLEIVGYDPASQTFPATVYSSMGGVPAAYYWDVQGDVVTHWTTGSKYTGTFNEDGTVLTGGWRAEEGNEGEEGATYDATMVKVNSIEK
jgi:hypothetical protein